MKVRARADPSRPARRDRSGRAPFDRRRYTLLCLVAAELLAAPVTTIGLLVDRVTQAAAADPLIDAFDTSQRAERMAYVDVLRMLESFGALEAVGGSTEAFVASATAKALYRVDATLVMRLLAAPNGPSQFAVPAEEVAVRFEELLAALRRERRYGDAPEAAHAIDGASDVQRNLWLRHSVFRRLVDDPVVYREDLSAAELACLYSPTGRQLLRLAVEQGGFVLEERAEGGLLVDPDALATDGKFPDDSSNAKIAALLMLDVITASDGGVEPDRLSAEADRLLGEFPRWAKAYRGEDGREQLVHDALAVLDEFGLARRSGELVVAIARSFALRGHRSEVGGGIMIARWAPTRAGILNVWLYYDEIFKFHKGRLLLHGPNGIGKSKALELLLPFLFDASLRANRLSTFGIGERTMHWNLMGDGAAGSTRVGYVWLEFKLGEEWFTCGARLQASTHTKTVHVDYFTTSRRVSVDLPLFTAAGQPLTKAGLADALGDRGDLHPTSAEYRTAVRTKLFPGLTEQRYDALITALLQLRQPKLSQRLDPGLLSTLLSHALPPFGEGEIAELAEGFERLDRQREHLRLLDAEVDAARRLATQQRGYAMRVLRASAANLISATSDLTRVARESA